MDLEHRLNEWVQRKLLPIDAEQPVHFAIRRHDEWSGMVGTTAWGDFAAMVQRARDGVVRDLVAGTPNRYGERGDDEKRAMIHAFDIVLALPLSVERDAEAARDSLNKFYAQRASRA